MNGPTCRVCNRAGCSARPISNRRSLISATRPLPLGRWLLEQACLALAALRAQSPAAHDVRVSVNVSRRQLLDPRLAADVRAILERTGVPADRLDLELTESAIIGDLDAAVLRLAELKEVGVGLHLDDFGTGYSSLGYLGQMPVDVLKLDKRFVDGVSQGDGHLLTRGILDLARALGKLVVAEGIERPEQAERLREHGCTLGQGFLFSRPVEGDRMRELVERDVAEAARALAF